MLDSARVAASAPPQPSYHQQLAQARVAAVQPPQPAASYYPAAPQASPQPLPGDDTTPTKLFVGGLSTVTCKEDLQEYFGQFSSVHDAVIQKHRITKQSRGFGFVTVASRKAADRILGQKHAVQGRTLNVTNCKSENQGAAGDTTGLTKLYVSDLRQHHTEQDLDAAFAPHGALKECIVMRHQDTGESRGFGFVTFHDHDHAKAAQAQRVTTLGADQARCKVVFASARPPPRGGPRGPPMDGGFGAPRGYPPMGGGYGYPPQQIGYGYPPPQQGYGYPPPQQGYAPPPGGRQPPPRQQGYSFVPQGPPQSYQQQGYAPQSYAPPNYPPQGYPPSGYPPQQQAPQYPPYPQQGGQAPPYPPYPQQGGGQYGAPPPQQYGSAPPPQYGSAPPPGQQGAPPAQSPYENHPAYPARADGAPPAAGRPPY